MGEGVLATLAGVSPSKALRATARYVRSREVGQPSLRHRARRVVQRQLRRGKNRIGIVEIHMRFFCSFQVATMTRARSTCTVVSVNFSQFIKGIGPLYVLKNAKFVEF